MLFVNKKYESLNRIIHIVNETKDSDSFESRCARYLRKNYPSHKFELKGGRDNQVSDILVDDSFYIECKMTENGKLKNGSQSTGFGIKLVDNDHFECSETAYDNEIASKIINYINRHFDEFYGLTQPLSGCVELPLDSQVSAEWINDYYKQKNVKFFITIFDGNLVIFKNTVRNLLKYFNISVFVRYCKYGTKRLPTYRREYALSELKNKLNIKSVEYKDKHTIISTDDELESKYFNTPEINLYLSDDGQPSGHYRVMRLSRLGSPRVVFSINSILDQDESDLNQFEKYLNSH